MHETCPPSRIKSSVMGWGESERQLSGAVSSAPGRLVSHTHWNLQQLLPWNFWRLPQRTPLKRHDRDGTAEVVRINAPVQKGKRHCASPVPVQPSVIVPVEKVRLRPQRAHVRVYPDELQHRPGASFLHANYQRVGQLLIPVFLRHARVLRLHLGPVAPRRGGGPVPVAGCSLGARFVQSRPDLLQRSAAVRFAKKFLGARASARRAPLPLVASVRHDCAAAEHDTIAQIGARQWHGEHEGESGAESVRRWEEPMRHVAMGSKRCMVFHRSSSCLGLRSDSGVSTASRVRRGGMRGWGRLLGDINCAQLAIIPFYRLLNCAAKLGEQYSETPNPDRFSLARALVK